MDTQELLDLMHREAVSAGIRALVVHGATRSAALFAIINAAQQRGDTVLAAKAASMYEAEAKDASRN